MFTGIIREIGTVKNISRRSDLATIEIEAKNITNNLEIGNSVAIDGACLTVTSIKNNSFKVDVVKETLDLTTLGGLKRSSKVNLENSLKAGGEIAGHFVTGHVDGIGIVKNIKAKGNSVYYLITPPAKLMKFIATKGSVTIDGISLTIAKTFTNDFAVALIPHTLKTTTIGNKKIGDKVNLEIDILARYINRLK